MVLTLACSGPGGRAVAIASQSGQVSHEQEDAGHSKCEPESL
jgi:hypothetical protein